VKEAVYQVSLGAIETGLTSSFLFSLNIAKTTHRSYDQWDQNILIAKLIEGYLQVPCPLEMRAQGDVESRHLCLFIISLKGAPRGRCRCVVSFCSTQDEEKGWDGDKTNGCLRFAIWRFDVTE
jgi:hypothetical protein